MTTEQARQSLQGSDLGVLAPPAGLEPATYGLEVRQHPSGWCHPGASTQVGSGSPSGQLHRERLCDNNRIARGIASPSQAPAVHADLCQAVTDYTR